MANRAVFLDRDGTLVYPRHYPKAPEELTLYPGIAPGLRTLQNAGFRLVMVTNQSGIARGLFSARDLTRMHSHLTRALSRLGVTLSGIYHCPHHPDGLLPELSVRCTCRKPQPGMVLRAAADLDIDLDRSWLVGDILDDIEAGNRAGCRTILVDLGTERVPGENLRQPTYVARNTRHALRIIAAIEHAGRPVDLSYRPLEWDKVRPIRASRTGQCRAQGGANGKRG